MITNGSLSARLGISSPKRNMFVAKGCDGRYGHGFEFMLEESNSKDHCFVSHPRVQRKLPS